MNQFCHCLRTKTKFLSCFLIVFVSAAFFTLNPVLPAKKAVAAGTTYYVRADGLVTCANKSTATSPNSANTSLSLTEVNVCSFGAGDQVLFSSQGGDYTSQFKLVSGGSGVGGEIIYANVQGETPKIVYGANHPIDTNSISNIKINGFSIVYNGSNATHSGIRVRTSSNITLSNLEINMGGYGYGINCNNAVSGVTIDSVNVSNGTTSLYLITFAGASSSNIIIRNSSTGSNCKGIFLDAVTGAIIENTTTSVVKLTSSSNGSIDKVTANGTQALVNAALILTNSTNVTVTDFTSSSTAFLYQIDGSASNVSIARANNNGGRSGFINGTANNITITDSSVLNSLNAGFTVGENAHDVTFVRCVADSILGNGFYVSGSAYNVNYYNSRADRTTLVGFLASNSSHDILYQGCEASYNGIVDTLTNGAGFLPHDDTYNIKIYNSIAHHNYTLGMGNVSSGANNIIANSVVWDNGYDAAENFNGSVSTLATTRGNLYFNKTGGDCLVENVIAGMGFPAEITDVGSPHPVFDYNIYYPVNNEKFVYDQAVYTSWSNYHLTNELHSKNTDPKFTDAGSDFRLQSTSPAIDAGIDLNITTDYAGNVRFDDPLVTNSGSVGAYNKNYVDIGAFEYVPPASTLSATKLPATGVAPNQNWISKFFTFFTNLFAQL